MAIQQGRHGYFSIGGTLYPVYNWQSDSPRNLAAPVALGSSWNGGGIAEAQRSSRIVCTFDVRSTSSNILFLSTAFWNLWLARTFGSGFDDTSTFELIASDGVQTATFANCKAESFVLTRRFGQQLGLQASFLAPDKPTYGSVTPAAYTNQLGSLPPLMHNLVTLAGVTGGDYGFQLQFANNHMPNARNAGTKALQGWDAGSPAAAFQVDVAANASAPFADDATLSIAITNVAASVTRTLTLTGVSSETVDNRAAQLGQIYRTHQCLVNGSSTVAPVTVT